MRIFKHKRFHQWTQSEHLKDVTLRQAIGEIEHGLYDANLGSGLYKKRVPMPGQGKKGGYRTLVAFKDGKNTFFVYGFAKNIRANISDNEKRIYRKLAKDFLNMSDADIHEMLDCGKLVEVK